MQPPQSLDTLEGVMVCQGLIDIDASPFFRWGSPSQQFFLLLSRHEMQEKRIIQWEPYLNETSTRQTETVKTSRPSHGTFIRSVGSGWTFSNPMAILRSWPFWDGDLNVTLLNGCWLNDLLPEKGVTKFGHELIESPGNRLLWLSSSGRRSEGSRNKKVTQQLFEQFAILVHSRLEFLVKLLIYIPKPLQYPTICMILPC